MRGRGIMGTEGQGSLRNMYKGPRDKVKRGWIESGREIYTVSSLTLLKKEWKLLNCASVSRG